MRVMLSKDEAHFLRNERLYLEEVNPRAAANVMRQLQTTFRLLGEHPQAGAPIEALEGRRRFVSGAYIVDYRVERSTCSSLTCVTVGRCRRILKKTMNTMLPGNLAL